MSSSFRSRSRSRSRCWKTLRRRLKRANVGPDDGLHRDTTRYVVDQSIAERGRRHLN
jgi:hypothetical protein